MKIGIGKSKQAKFDSAEQKAERLREWHCWFAWKPVYVARDDRRWLETVYRRAGWAEASRWWPGDVLFDDFEYRAVKP